MPRKNQKSKVKSQNLHVILEDIVEKKRLDVNKKKNLVEATLVVAQGNHRNHSYGIFRDVIASSKDIAIIAEIKLASPTDGICGSKKDILQRANSYEKAGAGAISIITEPHYFHGNISFIPKVKEVIGLPILQKDFVIDEYQIYESKMIGADALLLIARLIDEKTLQHFVSLCFQLGIEPVVEVANDDDLSKALVTETRIIAVNARDLTTFTVSIEKACELLQKIPEGFISLGFSGIHSSEDVTQYKKAGVSGVLVGTELMKRKNITEFILSLLGVKRRSNLTK